MSHLIAERVIAKQKGELYFRTTRPCNKGHWSLRYTSCGQCLECNKENSKKDSFKESGKLYYRKNKEKRIAHSQKWKAANPDRVKAHRVSYYGLTLEEYKALLTKQNHCCAICGDKLDLGKHTHIDHCHITGNNRGILCTHCNKGIGLFKDSIERMQKAIQYLKGFL